MRCSGRAVVALATTVTWSAARRSRARRLARLRREFERGNGGELTEVRRACSAARGKLWSRRSGDGDPRRPEAKKATATAPRDAPACVLGGELQSEEAELLRVSEVSCGDGSASAVAGESEREERKERERVREVRGGAWRHAGHPGDEGEARQAGGVAARRCARVGHTPGRLARGQRRLALCQWAGWAAQCQATCEHR